MTEADKLRLDHEARIYASREARKLAALDPRDVQEDAICTMFMIFHKNLAKVTAERDAMMAALREIESAGIDYKAVAIVRKILAAYSAAMQSQDTPAPSVDGWQPIETAPRDGTRILTWQPSGASPHEAILRREGKSNLWLDDRDQWFVIGPTHWMQLPAPQTEPVSDRTAPNTDPHPGVVVGPSNYQWIIAEALAAAHKEGWEAGKESVAYVAEALGRYSGTNVQPAIAQIVRELHAIPYPDPVEKEQP